jgi:hypothetical protein
MILARRSCSTLRKYPDVVEVDIFRKAGPSSSDNGPWQRIKLRRCVGLLSAAKGTEATPSAYCSLWFDPFLLPEEELF